MSMLPRIPDHVDRMELQKLHKNILQDLRRRAVTFERIGEMFGLSAAAISQYLVRAEKGSRPRAARGGASSGPNVMEVIHGRLVIEGAGSASLVDEDLLKAYRNYVAGGGATGLALQTDTISYKRRNQNKATPALYGCLSDIMHDAIGISTLSSLESAIQLAGVYYMYRLSTTVRHVVENGRPRVVTTVVKSLLEIRQTESGNQAIDFLHLHPDRQHRPGLDDLKKTRGIAFSIVPNTFLVGSTENGKALEVIALRNPTSRSPSRILGYTLTSNFDHSLISARVVLVPKPKDEAVELGRIFTHEFDAAKEKFSLNLLNRIDLDLVADSMSQMSMVNEFHGALHPK